MKSAATLMALTIRPLRVARMRVEAVKGDGDGVGREALGLDLAAAAAVHRVGAARAEPRDVEILRAASDLLVRRERDADRAVRDLRMRDEMGGRRHDLGDAGLVVGAEQRRARRGDDVVADLVCERGTVGQPQHGRRIVGQHEIAPIVAAVDDRLDVAPLISGDVSTWAMKPMAGTSALRRGRRHRRHHVADARPLPRRRGRAPAVRPPDRAAARAASSVLG